MKIDLKSFIIGILLTIVFILSFAAVQEHRIHGLSPNKILVKDAQNNLLLVDTNTTLATWVQYSKNNPPKNAIPVDKDFMGND